MRTVFKSFEDLILNYGRGVVQGHFLFFEIALIWGWYWSRLSIVLENKNQHCQHCCENFKTLRFFWVPRIVASVLIIKSGKYQYRLYFKQNWKIDIVKAQTETWIKLDIMSVFLRYKIFSTFHPVPQIIIWWNSNFSSFQGSSRHFKICCMQDYLIDFNEMAQVFECVKNCINCAKKIRPCIAVLDPLRAFFVSLSPQQ